MKHTVRDIYDILKSYYKVLESGFVDNVCMQGPDYDLIIGPDTLLRVFSPELVVELSAERACKKPHTQNSERCLSYTAALVIC